MGFGDMRANGPATVGDIVSSTWDNVRPEVTDNIYNGITTLRALKSMGLITREPGGAQIVRNLAYAKNSTWKFMSKSGVLDTTVQEQFTNLASTWRYAGGTATLYDADVRNNSGSEQQIYNLVKAVHRNAELTAMSNMNIALFNSSPASADIDPLPNLIAAGTICGIAGGTYSWWQSTVTTSGSFAAQGVKDLRTTFLTVRKGIDAPQLIIMSPTDYAYFENSQEVKQRYMGNAFDPGAEQLAFKSAAVVPDADAAAGTAYMLNLNYLELVVHQDAEFKMDSTPIIPANQFAQVWRIVWQGNLITTNRRMHGKIASITA